MSGLLYNFDLEMWNPVFREVKLLTQFIHMADKRQRWGFMKVCLTPVSCSASVFGQLPCALRNTLGVFLPRTTTTKRIK